MCVCLICHPSFWLFEADQDRLYVQTKAGEWYFYSTVAQIQVSDYVFWHREVGKNKSERERFDASGELVSAAYRLHR